MKLREYVGKVIKMYNLKLCDEKYINDKIKATMKENMFI